MITGVLVTVMEALSSCSVVGEVVDGAATTDILRRAERRCFAKGIMIVEYGNMRMNGKLRRRKEEKVRRNVGI